MKRYAVAYRHDGAVHIIGPDYKTHVYDTYKEAQDRVIGAQHSIVEKSYCRNLLVLEVDCDETGAPLAVVFPIAVGSLSVTLGDAEPLVITPAMAPDSSHGLLRLTQTLLSNGQTYTVVQAIHGEEREMRSPEGLMPFSEALKRVL